MALCDCKMTKARWLGDGNVTVYVRECPLRLIVSLVATSYLLKWEVHRRPVLHLPFSLIHTCKRQPGGSRLLHYRKQIKRCNLLCSGKSHAFFSLNPLRAQDTWKWGIADGRHQRRRRRCCPHGGSSGAAAAASATWLLLCRRYCGAILEITGKRIGLFSYFLRGGAIDCGR